MSTRRSKSRMVSCLAASDAYLQAVRSARTPGDLFDVMEGVSHDMGFRYFALIDHEDLRMPRPDLVDLKSYPPAIVDRLIGQNQYRRDPVIRGCIFAEGTFLWSEMSEFMGLDHKDRQRFELGVREGLNEGITTPYVRLGHCMGSCTFAGTRRPERAHRYIGIAHMVGIFGFQAARRMVAPSIILPGPPRLHPRPRDCVILAGRGLSNKEIARALALTPRTVDGYLTEARRLFDARDRTELVVSAVLAGEIGLHELRPRQPE